MREWAVEEGYACGERGEARPLTSSTSNKSTSQSNPSTLPSCVRMWTVGKCGKRAWELVCVGVRVTGGRQGRGRLIEETLFACPRTRIATHLVKLTSQEASMDVVQGFVLTAAAPCTGLCAGRRKSLKPSRMVSSPSFARPSEKRAGGSDGQQRKTDTYVSCSIINRSLFGFRLHP